MFKELKGFLFRGNVVDLAVAVVIGGAFGKIIVSFVDDILMPVISLFTGGVNFSERSIVMKEAVVDATGVTTSEAVKLGWGNLVQNVIMFVIVGTVLFFILKALVKKEAPAPPAGPTPDQELLTEIRDLLKK